MKIKKLANGNLLVPCSAIDEDGTTGDAIKEISPGTPGYEEWMKYLEKFKEDLID